MAQLPAPELSALLLPDQERPVLEQPLAWAETRATCGSRGQDERIQFWGFSLHKEIGCNQDSYHRMSKPWNYCQNGGSWEQKDIILILRGKRDVSSFSTEINHLAVTLGLRR